MAFVFWNKEITYKASLMLTVFSAFADNASRMGKLIICNPSVHKNYQLLGYSREYLGFVLEVTKSTFYIIDYIFILLCFFSRA